MESFGASEIKTPKGYQYKTGGQEEMIYTVTFNPSLDYIVSVDDFKLGLTNRTSSELMLPGGKGINVSTVLMNLGIENTALGFTAGFVGKEIIRRLHEMGVKSEFIQISEGVSRINLKLKSIDGTEINGAGPVISKDKVEELMKKLEELGLTEYLMKKYARKETASQYRELDNTGLISELSTRLEDKAMSVIDQVKFEKEYLQYVVYVNPKVNQCFYVVTDYKTFKEVRKPYCVLHNIKTGEDVKARVTSIKVYQDNPFGEFSILKVPHFTKKRKKKCVNGTWQETDELENILDEYEVIK